MSGTGGFNHGSGNHAGGHPVPPFVVDPKDGENNTDNEFVHTPETDEVNPNHKNEEDKERERSDEDFVKFDVDKVDDLEKSKEQTDEDDTKD